MMQNRDRRTVFLAGATGYIGSRVLDTLLAGSTAVEVLALTRRADVATSLRARGVTPIMGDLMVPGPWQQAAREANAVIHVAQPAAFSQRGTHKFGLQYQQQRLEQDVALLNSLEPAGRQRIIYVSGHSYFGDTGRNTLGDETMDPKPIGFGPYIVPAVENVRRQIARGLDIVSVYPGAVYAYGSWTKLYVIDRLREGKKLLAMPGEPCLCSPIHVQDCARAIAWMLDISSQQVQELGRDFLLVDDKPVSYATLNEAFATALGKPAKYFRVPAFLAKLMLGSINYNYQTSNCAYSNARLHATGFKFLYPEISQGAAAVIAEAKKQWARSGTVAVSAP